jgi:hypothetical protein
MVVMILIVRMAPIIAMTPATGEKQTPASGEQGGECQHKE